MQKNTAGILLDVVLVVAVALILLYKRRTVRMQADLFRYGIKICGKVLRVKYEWVGLRAASRYYELYAEFEYDGKTYYALKKCRVKPGYQVGDPIGICFDPNDPGENMILDFSDQSAEQ